MTDGPARHTNMQCVDVDRRGPKSTHRLLGREGLLAMAMDGVRAPALALAFSRERARGETLRERVTSTPWPENVVSLLGGRSRSIIRRRGPSGRHMHDMHVHQGQMLTASPRTQQASTLICVR
jgi:hypothetical protein